MIPPAVGTEKKGDKRLAVRNEERAGQVLRYTGSSLFMVKDTIGFQSLPTATQQRQTAQSQQHHCYRFGNQGGYFSLTEGMVIDTDII